MTTLTKTLMEGLNDKTAQALLNVLPMPMTYQLYFPIVENPFFSWKTLSNNIQKPNIAADLQAQNSSTARKRRPNFQVASGDLPLISISREMSREKMKEYQIMLSLAGGNTANANLVRFWADDITFCFNGVQAEYEYIAWAILSKAGKLAFTTANNATFANEFDLDYQVSSDNKAANSTSWATAASADPIGDFQTIMKQAKALGLNIKHVWINQDNAYLLQATAQMKDLTQIYRANATKVVTIPSIAEINQSIQNIELLKGLTIHVVDQLITRELTDGTSTSANPFDDNVAVFTESTTLGSSQFGKLQQTNPAVIYAQRENTLIKKYGNAEPVSEVTIGESDGIPVLDTAYRNLYLKTNAVAW